MGTKYNKTSQKILSLNPKNTTQKIHQNPKDDNITPLYAKKRQLDKYEYVCGYAPVVFCDVLIIFSVDPVPASFIHEKIIKIISLHDRKNKKK